jgi:hypothetical protein
VYLRSILIDDLSILIDLLLSTKHTIEQLNCIILLVDIELPYEKLLRSVMKQIREGKMEVLTL